MIYCGKTIQPAFSPANRGLNYGDGLFETLRVHVGELPLWPRHLARLREGAGRLGITLPDADFLEARIGGMIAGEEAGVLKLLVTRGDGGRGYAAAAAMEPVWQLRLHPLPPAQTSLRLGWCETRLAIQPRLAGIKHCNRLEQVLARAEIDRVGCDEGLMRDGEGRVVGATAANLLAFRQGRWLTPPVERCGVAGVLRGVLLEAGLVDVAEMTVADVETAEALALCNAVRGILQVGQLGERRFRSHPDLYGLQMALSMRYPMFSTPGESA